MSEGAIAAAIFIAILVTACVLGVHCQSTVSSAAQECIRHGHSPAECGMLIKGLQ